MAELFTDLVEIQNAGSLVTIRLDANGAIAELGADQNPRRSQRSGWRRHCGAAPGWRLGNAAGFQRCRGGCQCNCFGQGSERSRCFTGAGEQRPVAARRSVERREARAIQRIGTTGNEGDISVDTNDAEVFQFDANNPS